jgi:hypothetical protein
MLNDKHTTGFLVAPPNVSDEFQSLYCGLRSEHSSGTYTYTGSMCAFHQVIYRILQIQVMATLKHVRMASLLLLTLIVLPTLVFA